MCCSYFLCICQFRPIFFDRSTKRHSATSYLGDADLGLETQGYRKKCLQHKSVSKSRERLHLRWHGFASSVAMDYPELRDGWQLDDGLLLPTSKML